MARAATKVEMWPLERIKPYEKNAKKHPQKQIDALAEVIRAHGFDQPIVIDEHGVIIKGHGRLLAAKQLALKKAPGARTMSRSLRSSRKSGSSTLRSSIISAPVFRIRRCRCMCKDSHEPFFVFEKP